ncbi:type II toxin-antitoxin system HicB family antitoxin [Lacibacterium aquatile]|uniref:Type II toxin-antitoxin system HicB family antitoxin n=1 Tax=Lacibacterium aquatile TaxID=1168082 RepID=A0ABW5DT41_9PROT
MARYPAWLAPIEEGFCVTFPDFPGCLAVGGTIEVALIEAEAALSFHLEGLHADGVVISPQALHTAILPTVDGAILVLIPAAPAKAPAVRVNITLDKNLLGEIDAAAAEAGFTRSGFLAEASRRMIRKLG